MAGLTMIYKFTNAAGRVNYGLIVEATDTGYYVLFDRFDIRDGVTLPARYSFVSGEGSPYALPNDAKREVLPATEPVRWSERWLSDIQDRMIEEEFTEWWKVNRERITGDLYGRYQ